MLEVSRDEKRKEKLRERHSRGLHKYQTIQVIRTTHEFLLYTNPTPLISNGDRRLRAADNFALNWQLKLHF